MKVKKNDHPASPQRDSLSPNLSDRVSHKVRYMRSSSRSDPRQVRSAQALRNALLTLLERKDFDQITVREICAVAGVHNATFFRHHADKEALLDHVASDEIKRLVGFSLPAGPGREGFEAMCAYVNDHRAVWTALLTGGAGGAMREELMRVSKSLAADYETMDSWLPHELSIICTTTLIVETISWWLTQDETAYSPKDMAQILDRLVSSAMMGPKGKGQKPGPRLRQV